MNPVFFSGLGALKSLLAEEHATYFSTPVTSGPKLIEKAKSKFPTELDAADKHEIIVQNRLAAAANAIFLRSKCRFVINPADFDKVLNFPDWNQQMFGEFWLKVIQEFCNECIVDNGWFLSGGCSNEVAFALSNNIPIKTFTGQKLDGAEALLLLDSSILQYQNLQLNCDSLIRSRKSIFEL